MGRREWVILLGLVAASILAYANSLGGDFCYDENLVILRNDNVQDHSRILSSGPTPTGAVPSRSAWTAGAGVP